MALPYKWQWRIQRWKDDVRRFFGVGGQSQPRPRLCPSCGTLVGVNATRCHQCGTNLRYSLAAASRGLSGFFGGEAPVTTAMLAANLLMFGVSWLALSSQGEGGGLSILMGMQGEALYRLGFSSPYGIFVQHEWFRLITAMFLHGGLLHIGFNMMALLQLGPALEELYGSARYLFVYVLTGSFGFLASAFLGHNNSLGASGALLGLVGAILAVTTRRGGTYMRALRSRLISSVVLLFALGFMGMGIDNYAHFGGLAVGFGLGRLFPDRAAFTPGERRLDNVLGWLAGLAIIVSFALMILHFHDPLPGQG